MSSSGIVGDFELQRHLLFSEPEGPFKNLLLELLERVIFFTDLGDKLNTRLVNHTWNNFTLSACKYPHKACLQQLIRLLTENLDPNKYSKFIGNLVEIQETHQTLICFMVNPLQFERLFLKTKAKIITILKNLTLEERGQLARTISNQLPDSMKNIFWLTNLSVIESIQTNDFEIFYMLFHASEPLTDNDRGNAVQIAAETGQTQMLSILLASGPISQSSREAALINAATQNYLEPAKLLLDHGPILNKVRAVAVVFAIKHQNQILEHLLLEQGPIDENARGEAVLDAVAASNEKVVKLLLKNGTISEEHTARALQKAARTNRLIFQSILCDYNAKMSVRYESEGY